MDTIATPAKKKKRRISGWMSIKEPADLERALVRMLNYILASADPIENAGRFSNLANAWVNVRKLGLDIEVVKDLEARIADLEGLMRYEATKSKERLAEIVKSWKEFEELLEKCQ
ncbi:MAG: hypothetical protein MUO26_05395 [Methanotrichaceae archaeon]|nr:hypothetical protein [Methanotrichaceae archaeon]